MYADPKEQWAPSDFSGYSWLGPKIWNKLRTFMLSSIVSLASGDWLFSSRILNTFKSQQSEPVVSDTFASGWIVSCGVCWYCCGSSDLLLAACKSLNIYKDKQWVVTHFSFPFWYFPLTSHSFTMRLYIHMSSWKTPRMVHWNKVGTLLPCRWHKKSPLAQWGKL